MINKETSVYLHKGAEDLRRHLEAPLPLAVVHQLGSHRCVGLRDDGLVVAAALCVQLGPEEETQEARVINNNLHLVKKLVTFILVCLSPGHLFRPLRWIQFEV